MAVDAAPRSPSSSTFPPRARTTHRRGPVQVKALPGNLSFSTKIRVSDCSHFLLYRQFTSISARGNDARRRPGAAARGCEARARPQQVEKEARNDRPGLAGELLSRESPVKSPKSPRRGMIYDGSVNAPLLTYGVHRVRQVAHTQESHQHREVVALYEGVITLVP